MQAITQLGTSPDRQEAETLPKPTLKQILDALKKEVLFANSRLAVAKGLMRADPVILQVAPTFFGLTLDGNLEMAQMAIAKLYDKTAGTITMEEMLDQASLSVGSFQRGGRQDIHAAVAKAKKGIEGLQPVLSSIRTRRNEWLAHLDPQTVENPQALAAKAKLTIPDLERALNETEEILLDIDSLYAGVIGDLRFVGADDYKTALDWIRKAKCAFIREYEKEFKTTWTGPRPNDCSKAPNDLL
jgi:hypothetical protein